ncbi:helix-turn-helix domain-containing protein [Azospirillum agricola]|uniref:helix-turn-helix domain-containing protein n=1 Tax=Azospirillum agricola TaxID=1720247 RepID=UPI000A0F1F62|nr:helix-turn-helix transcriptional regulator [Azospirillum agricola]SMH62829.1 transcriptional regulator, XRE family [Azospirillum lipoferum]
MTSMKDLHANFMKDAAYREAYEALEEEFTLAQAIIEARTNAGLTQEQLAERMETSQSAIARLESGKVIPSARTLTRFARATGTRLRITFETEKGDKGAGTATGGIPSQL